MENAKLRWCRGASLRGRQVESVLRVSEGQEWGERLTGDEYGRRSNVTLGAIYNFRGGESEYQQEVAGSDAHNGARGIDAKAE